MSERVLKTTPLPPEKMRELFRIVEVPKERRREESGLVRRVRVARYLVGGNVGSLCANGYWKTSVDSNSTGVHRIINAIATGVDPGELVVDHLDGNPMNNHPDNLAAKTRRGNVTNSRARRGGSSAYPGVAWQAREARWRAQMEGRTGGKRKYIGTFEEEKAAAIAYLLEYYKRHGSYLQHAQNPDVIALVREFPDRLPPINEYADDLFAGSSFVFQPPPPEWTQHDLFGVEARGA